MAAQLLDVKISAPFQKYFEGQAASVSAINATGPFDVLPMHKNFISLLSPCTLTVRIPEQSDFSIDVERGLMHVRSNQVTVFLEV